MTPHHPARSDLQLAALQLAAIDAFNRARRTAERAAAVTVASRETRMDLDRRLEVLRTSHAAVVARTEEQLRRSVALLRRTCPPRALVAHRSSWFAGRLSADLAEHGVDVLAQLDNGAEVIGAAVAEQPDLLVVGDHLAMVGSEDVVREVRQYVPDCLIAVQVAYGDGIAPMLAAGATAAYPRRLAALDVSADLVRLLEAGSPGAARAQDCPGPGGVRR